jgi:AcrR family transcriptional regulator
MATATYEPSKARIVRCATELFAGQGYHATSVREIGDAAGLGRGALYHHIKSKEQLLYEISMSIVIDMLDQARVTLESELSPEGKLRALARDLLRNLAENRSGWRVSVSQAQALSPDLRDEVYRTRDSYEEVWAGVIAEGVAAGTFDPVSPLILRGILGLFNTTFLWLDPSGPTPPDHVADIYIDMLLDGLRPRS